MRTHIKKPPLEIHIIYLGNKRIHCIFKTCCIISVLFSTKCHLYHKFIFFYSNNMFYIKHVLKFKYQCSHLKIKHMVQVSQITQYISHLLSVIQSVYMKRFLWSMYSDPSFSSVWEDFIVVHVAFAVPLAFCVVTFSVLEIH
jgi:hypothetical protein